MMCVHQPEEVLARLRDAVQAAGGVRAFARRHSVSASMLSDQLRGKHPIAPAVARAVGFAPYRGFVLLPFPMATAPQAGEGERG